MPTLLAGSSWAALEHSERDGWHPVEVTRPLDSDELDVLTTLLGHGFTGVDELREQLSRATVFSSCDCGCGSLGFSFTDPSDVPRSRSANPLPVEADIVGPDGTLTGGLIVLLRDGLLHDVDVFSFTDGPLAFPRASEVRWRTATRAPGTEPAQHRDHRL